MIVPVDYEEVTCLTSAANALNTTTVAALGNVKCRVEILVTGNPVAWLQHGVAPTSATLNVAQVGSIITLHGRLAAAQFQAIGLGGTSVLPATYFRRK